MSDLVLHCLPMSHKKDARLKWIKIATITLNMNACWVIFHAFLLSADFFSKSNFSKNLSRNTIRVLNSEDSDQVRQNVRHDLGSNCLQRLSPDEKFTASKEY